MDQPPWLAAAWAELGQREVRGSADNARISALFRDAGQTAALHDEVAWCAAFVGACLERAGNTEHALADGALVSAAGARRWRRARSARSPC